VNGVGGAAALSLIRPRHDPSAPVSEPTCFLNQEQEEGPYYLDGEILRRDITEARVGVPPTLPLTVMDVKGCKPIRGAALDIWHCDAFGTYSGYGFCNPTATVPSHHLLERREAAHQTAVPRGLVLPRARQPISRLFSAACSSPMPTSGQLRHYLSGLLSGPRNIHLKVHVGGHSTGRDYQGGQVCHTGHILFPEEITTAVLAEKPYSTHDIRRTTLAKGRVFNRENSPPVRSYPPTTRLRICRVGREPFSRRRSRSDASTRPALIA
jgi:hypothetical protein